MTAGVRISREQREKIFRLSKEGVTAAVLGRRFGYSSATIRKIVAGLRKKEHEESIQTQEEKE